MGQQWGNNGDTNCIGSDLTLRGRSLRQQYHQKEESYLEEDDEGALKTRIATPYELKIVHSDSMLKVHFITLKIKSVETQ